MSENWEIVADTREKWAKKCANQYCRIYCDLANKCTCNKCNLVFCIKCRLYDTHHCEVEKREREERENTGLKKILFGELSKYEEIYKKAKLIE